MDLTQEQKDALEKYEELKIQEKEIQELLEPLKEIILPIMQKDMKLQGHNGTFEMKEKTTWKYSPEVTQEEDRLKALKEDEVAKGIAIKKATPYLEYRRAKGE